MYLLVFAPSSLSTHAIPHTERVHKESLLHWSGFHCASFLDTFMGESAVSLVEDPEEHLVRDSRATLGP